MPDVVLLGRRGGSFRLSERMVDGCLDAGRDRFLNKKRAPIAATRPTPANEAPAIKPIEVDSFESDAGAVFETFLGERLEPRRVLNSTSGIFEVICKRPPEGGT